MVGGIGAIIVIIAKTFVAREAVFVEELPVFLRFFSYSRFLYAFLSFFLILFSSWIFQQILNIGGLLYKRIKLPFLFSVLILLMLPIEKTISLIPIVIISEFAIYNLFCTYNNPEAIKNQFNIGLFIGLASVLQPVMTLFFPIFLIGLYILLSWSVKSLLRTFLGFITPIWIHFGYMICTEQTMVFFEHIRLAFQLITFENLLMRYVEFIVLGIIFLIFIICSVEIFFHGLVYSLKVRKEINFLLTFFLLSGSLLVLKNQIYLFVALSSLSLPLFMSRLLTGMNRKVSGLLYPISMFVFLSIYVLQIWIF